MKEWMLWLGLQSNQPEMTTINTQAIDSAPILQWNVPLPETAALNAEFAQPLIHEQRIYIGSSQQPELLIYERSTGALIETIAVDAPIQSQPKIHDGNLYIADTGGTIYRYTLAGKKVWSKGTNAPILSTINIHGTQLLVQNVDDVVYALDPSDGKLLWRYAHQTDISRRRDMTLYGAPAPVILDEFVYCGFSDGAVVQLLENDGTVENIRWIGEGRYPDIIAAPSEAHGQIIISGAEEPLTAYDSSLQEEFWRIKAGTNHSIVQLDEEVFLHSGTDGTLRALETRTGAEMWRWESGIQAALSEPLLTPMGVFVASSGGTLYCIDLDTHEEVWSFQPSYHISGLQHSPALSGNEMVWLSNAGILYSFISPIIESKSCTGLFCEWTGKQ
jgi:outer membrane protein assembly factor BamB